ncbi:MAG TPA: dihydroorotate dehydrogenase electron transfer subunit [Vicinamibacteria bacterium]|nr:dihydroorotate dehydrogenase electron transfer subunit [Vicinamibacteria bacterium]
MKRDERAVLFEREALSPDTCLLHFRSESLFRSFLPGQFTMVRLPEASGLLLRRPYSFCDVRAERSSFSLLVKEVGAGTRALARLAIGTSVDCLGPLGSSFQPPPNGRTPLIVAGGVGIAPFLAFCRMLARRGVRAIVLLGGRTSADLYLRDEFVSLGMDVRSATEDGSYGHDGLVTEVLAEVLKEETLFELYSCGPTPMLVRVARMARERGLPHQVSLERRMGCGMGCCLGCVVFVHSSNEYVRCCTEGPVYDADEVAWERDPYPL